MSNKNADKLRKAAAGLDKKIAPLIHKSLGDRTWTRKRAEEIEAAHREGHRLDTIRGKMLALAAMMDNDSEPQDLAGLNTFACAEVLQWLTRWPSNDGQRERLERNGITAINFDVAKQAWSDLTFEASQSSAVQALDTKIRGLAGRIEGFWPTPRELADRMIRMAKEHYGDKVVRRALEPSAGGGDIVMRMVYAFPTAEIVAVETNHTLFAILNERVAVHRISAIYADFMEFDRGQFDVILMNPPFERGQDMDHVMRAYRMLAPGGVLVAIMSPSWSYTSTSKASNFRENYAELSYADKASWHAIEEAAFKKMGTGIRVGIMVMQK